jgi:hypothetical protein
MNSKDIVIKIDDLVNATADAMISLNLDDLTRISTSRTDQTNIWNIIALKFDTLSFYRVALNIYHKWHKNRKFVELVQTKIRKNKQKIENNQKISQIEFYVTSKEWDLIKSKVLYRIINSIKKFFLYCLSL